MQLLYLKADPHPLGNQMVLSWTNPDPVGMPGIRIMRREGTHPTAPNDGTLVAEGTTLADSTTPEGHALYRVLDAGLKGETVYYYSLFPFQVSPNYVLDRRNRTAGMATAPHGLPAHLYGLLPNLYRRYDTRPPRPSLHPAMLPADTDKGQLQRLLEIIGGQFDQFYSFTQALPALYDVERVDGRLLPLLAEWIGWQTDYRLEIDAQRNEVRRAPKLYQRIGIVPTVEATIKRLSGWESRTKEYVHNVLRSNTPARMNLWAQRLSGGTVPSDPLSLDYAYAGRPAAVRDDLGITWLFYHTQRKGQWSLWYKTAPTVVLGLDVQDQLVDGATVSPALQTALADVGLDVPQAATLAAAGALWRITDGVNNETYVVEVRPDDLLVYHTSAGAALAPSQPLTAGKVLEQHPAAALEPNTNTLWVYWQTYDDATGWAIQFMTRQNGAWSAPQPFFQGAEDAATPGPPRKNPALAVDAAGRLWVFWLQKENGRWQVRYNRRSNAGTAWSLVNPAVFPLDGPDDPRVEADLYVVARTGNPQLAVFWARKDGPNRQHWSIAYRTKQGANPNNTGDWNAVQTVPKAGVGAYHDRDPAPRILPNGRIELLWCSDRDRTAPGAEGSRSIWHSTLTNFGANTWSAAAALTDDAYDQCAPVLLADAAGANGVLFYRSNRSVAYTSTLYGATATHDLRYAGAGTVAVRNAERLRLRTLFEDFLTYTYDAGKATGRDDADRIARDTIGCFVEPDTLDPAEIDAVVARIRQALRGFMPATDRAVFVPPGGAANVFNEAVYRYDVPMIDPGDQIVSSFTDQLNGVLTETLFAPGGDFSDILV